MEKMNNVMLKNFKNCIEIYSCFSHSNEYPSILSSYHLNDFFLNVWSKKRNLTSKSDSRDTCQSTLKFFPRKHFWL